MMENLTDRLQETPPQDKWLIRFVLAIFVAMLIGGCAMVICGCASPAADDGAKQQGAGQQQDSGAQQGAGFQSASGNALDIGDIGDRFSTLDGDIANVSAKVDALRQELKVIQTGMINLQNNKTEINSGKYLFWALVVACTALMAREWAYFRYKSVKRKTFIPSA